ncbi:head GIN domain-containing protein [Chloroflexota bacterium]
MKKLIVAVLVVALITSVLLTGCGAVIGSGNVVTENFDFSDFTKLEAQTGFEVELIRSNSYSIEITTDDNIQEYLDVTKSDDTLRIRLTGYLNYSSVTLKAKITMPDIYGISLSGGSQAEVTGFSSSHDFSAALSGGSRLEGDITTGDAKFDLSGGSRVTLAGSADDLVIKSSGGSKSILESFPVDNADINISGGGSATIDVSGTLDVNLSGGSKAIYDGEPQIGDIDLSGGSTFSKK